MSQFERTSERFWDSFRQLHAELAQRIAAEDERACREVTLRWLPSRLKWLVNHPRVLRWYVRLPHRTRPMCLQIGAERFWTVG